MVYNFTVPCLWDEEKIEEILMLKGLNGRKITEVYGAIPNEVIVTGRYNKTLNEMDKEKALYIKKHYIDSNELGFAYLINAPIDIHAIDEIAFKEYLDWIVNVFQATSLTISSKTLIKRVRELYPKVNLNISTIAGIKDEEGFKEFLQFNPSRVILHHDCVKDIVTLKRLVELCDQHHIILEIMVNESCLNHCPSRAAHYNCLADNQDDHKYHQNCNLEKIIHPYQLLYANYIRPEDVNLYSELGIHHFKITGRSKPIWWHKEVVKAYLEGRYNGNLIRLLGIDPALEGEKLIYINNQSLDGFTQCLVECVEKQLDLCKKKICELHQTKDFYVMREDINYQIESNELVCLKACDNLYMQNDNKISN